MQQPLSPNPADQLELGAINHGHAVVMCSAVFNPRRSNGRNHLTRSSSRGGRCFSRGLLLLRLLSKGSLSVCTYQHSVTSFALATSNTEPSKCQQGAISRISVGAVCRHQPARFIDSHHMLCGIV